jgi:hypothetical protein
MTIVEEESICMWLAQEQHQLPPSLMKDNNPLIMKLA